MRAEQVVQGSSAKLKKQLPRLFVHWESISLNLLALGVEHGIDRTLPSASGLTNCLSDLLGNRSQGVD